MSCDVSGDGVGQGELSFLGFPEAARLLLSYGAKVNEKDEDGKTPLQVATSKGHDEMMKLLLEHGAVPQP